MNEEIKLEIATETDYSILDKFQIESFSIYDDFFKEEISLSLCKPSLYTQRDSKNNYVYKASINDKIVGCIMVKTLSPSEMYIHRIFVFPEYQRRGYGTQILNTLIKLYDTINTFSLHCPEKIKSNVYFYSKCGFVLNSQNTQTINNIGDLLLKNKKKNVTEEQTCQK